MEPEDVQRVFDQHWKQRWGSITVEDAMYIQSKIRDAQPRVVLEVGMASGISAGIIALFMAENGGERIVTIDDDNTFFGDPTKENGFLTEAIVGDTPIDVVKRPFTVALDIQTLPERPFDLAFVDANHQHPWPLLDTMCLYPYLTGDRIVLHHDLALYKSQPIVFGIGPKFLYDQIPGSLREVGRVRNKNIFTLRLAVRARREFDLSFHVGRMV